MKFLVDECTSKLVYTWLKENFDTKYVQDIMRSASDNEVLDFALKENRIIVTRDKDFGEIVFRDKKTHYGIILLRLNIKHPVHQLNVLKKVIEEYSSKLQGNFTVATDNSIKIINFTFN